jgi:hypothetical protein
VISRMRVLESRIEKLERSVAGMSCFACA